MIDSSTKTKLIPAAGRMADATEVGFRFGAKGTHSSRTLMFDELSSLLSATRPEATRQDYTNAIVELNCLAKPTAASRRLTNQRIGELYGLERAVPLFRIFRKLWDFDPAGRRLLAIECALARDPLLTTTVPAILALRPGDEFLRDPVTAALRNVIGDRMNDNVLAKVVRNVASSWTQSGHLEGRTFKKRRLVDATPATIAFALYLGHAVGFRGAELFSTGWIAVLDCDPPRARALALDAKRIGLIDLRVAGDVIQLNLDRLDPVSRN